MKKGWMWNGGGINEEVMEANHRILWGKWKKNGGGNQVRTRYERGKDDKKASGLTENALHSSFLYTTTLIFLKKHDHVIVNSKSYNSNYKMLHIIINTCFRWNERLL